MKYDTSEDGVIFNAAFDHDQVVQKIFKAYPRATADNFKRHVYIGWVLHEKTRAIKDKLDDMDRAELETLRAADRKRKEQENDAAYRYVRSQQNATPFNLYGGGECEEWEHKATQSKESDYIKYGIRQPYQPITDKIGKIILQQAVYFALLMGAAVVLWAVLS